MRKEIYTCLCDPYFDEIEGRYAKHTMFSSRTPAHEFFDMHVAPNHGAWQAHTTDIRLAMNVVVSLYHMADHFWHAYSKTDPSRVFSTRAPSLYRAELARQNQHFSILRDVAEAHKHMKLDRPVRNLTKSRQTLVGSTGYGQANYGTGPYGGGLSIVVVLDNGAKHHLNYLAQEVKQFWYSMLK